MASPIDLGALGIDAPQIVRNPSPAVLYEDAIRSGDGCLSARGALIASSGSITGRSPSDKRIVRRPETEGDIWWGKVNIELEPASFEACRDRALAFLDRQDRLYVIDAFAGWETTRQLKVRVICVRPYHALFMHNMLVRPSPRQLESYGEPDFVILNAGGETADDRVAGIDSSTSVALDFGRRELVILGTEYAGEMKKGVFTILNYLAPRDGDLSMHCSANEGHRGDVSLLFGLSGTGKTTLSADPVRSLVGDDEHVWTDDGIYNIEGGCYAKCIGLSEEKEPLIHHAIRFGAVLENVVYDPQTREVDYDDGSITENTRASYPVEFIPDVKIPCVGAHPSNIFLLTCDAFGVLPPISHLTPEQAMYHFISGYTAKVAGTEVGVSEPQASFSPCFGAPFLVWHPMRYAELLAERMRRHGTRAWLINTGWTGGPYGVGERIKLAYTRALIDAVHTGKLDDAEFVEDAVFGLGVPGSVPGVPDEILTPASTWPDPSAYDTAARELADRFRENFRKYHDLADPRVEHAGPRATAAK